MATKTPKTETLHCSHGHTWKRPKVRGRKPLWCPKHAPIIERPTDPMETLTCKACGNEWERERKRGKKPPRCPDCTPQVVDGEPKPIGPPTIPVHRIYTPTAKALLADPERSFGYRLSRVVELREQMEYIVQMCETGMSRSGMWRETDDLDLLMTRHKHICREYERILASRRVVVPVDEDEAIAA